MEGRALQRLDEQITAPDARLRDEPEIAQAQVYWTMNGIMLLRLTRTSLVC